MCLILIWTLCALANHGYAQRVTSVRVAGIGGVPVCQRSAPAQAWTELTRTVAGNTGRDEAGLVLLDADGCQLAEVAEAGGGVLIPVVPPGTAQLEPWAVLISGHAERFVFRDSGLERLFSSLRRQGYATDVYVALQTGESNKPFYHGRDAGLPYQLRDDAALVLAAKQFLLEAGAATVQIELHTHTALEEKQASLLELLRAHGMGDRAHQVLKHELAQYRWGAHGKMFLLRHYAFIMCMANSVHVYDKIVYLREDNHFYESPAVRTITTHLRSAVSSPVVVVDKFCTFNSTDRSNAVNDKIFFVNKHGGELLFGNITRLFEAWFVEAYTKWLMQCFDMTGSGTRLAGRTGQSLEHLLRRSLYEERTLVEEHVSRQIHIEFDVLRTEEFLWSYLNERNHVIQFSENLYRIDLRYFWKQKCVPSAYYHCASVPGAGYPKCLGWACPNTHRFCNPWDPNLTKAFVRSCFRMAACTTELRARCQNNTTSKCLNLRSVGASPCTLLQVLKHLESMHTVASHSRCVKLC